jgi:hypothetical protein
MGRSLPGMVRNERLKLFANFLNALGLGLIAIAALRPAFETGGEPVRIFLWFLAGIALHAVAHYVLGYLL